MISAVTIVLSLVALLINASTAVSLYRTGKDIEKRKEYRR